MRVRTCVFAVVIALGLCLAATAQDEDLTAEFGQFRWCWGHSFGTVRKPEYHEFILASHPTHVCLTGFPRGTALPDRAEHDRLLDIVKQDNEFLHEHGIKVLGYHPGTFLYGEPDAPVEKTEGHEGPLKRWFDFFENRWEQQYQEYFGERPTTDPMTWIQVKADGTPIPYSFHGPAGYYFCSYDPDYQRYARGLIDMMIDAGYDGCYLDSTGVWNAKGACYCDDCKTAFREFLAEMYTDQERAEVLGIEDLATLEPPTELADETRPLWTAWERFHAQASPQLLAMLREHARKRDPDFTISCNYCHSWKDLYVEFSGTYGPALNYDLINRVQDFGLVEHARRPLVLLGKPGGWWYEDKPYAEGRYLYSPAHQYRYLAAAAKGRPSVVMVAIGWWHLSHSPGCDNATKAIFAEAYANGVVPDYSYTYLGVISPKQQQAVIRYNDFFIANADLLTGARLHSNVGLWNSVQQAYAGLSSVGYAVGRLLTDNSIFYVSLGDADITDEGLADLDVLVLPHVPMISDQQSAAIVRFLNRGGGLVIFGETGTHDGYGRFRAEGQVLVDGDFPTEPKRWDYGPGRVSYLPRGDCPVTFYEGPNRWMTTGIPEFEHELTRFLRMIPDQVRWAADGPLTCEVADEADTTEHTVMRTRDGKLLVHLVNFNIPLKEKYSQWWRDPEKAAESGLSESFLKLLEEGTWGGKPNNKAEGLRREWDPELHPERDLKVTLRPDEGMTVSKVTLKWPDLDADQELSFETVADGCIAFTVPELRIYDMIVVE